MNSFSNPRIGLVISKTSFDHDWMVTQMSAHGWAAVAHLAGIPYDCLLTSDVSQTNNLSKYSVLIFGQCTHIEKRIFSKFITLLKSYREQGGNIIIDGPLGLFNENAQRWNQEELNELLGIEYSGCLGNSEYRIKVADNSHYITRPFKFGQWITPHQADGLNISTFKNQGQVLLVSSNERISYPFLSVVETHRNRILLINDFSTWAGVASFFRNENPKGFFPNRMFDVLIRAVHWSLYGDLHHPFPVPQLTHADLTAIIRLDADFSSSLEVQRNTIDYLITLAKDTGVVPVYGWVSRGARKAGWRELAPLGKMLEDIGGQIGTHSKSHFVHHDLNETLAIKELDGSVQDIEFNMNNHHCPIGKIECFINPGITISMEDYKEIAKRFVLYMTHGFEEVMPLGYGNMRWFTGSCKNLAALDNSPIPDYHWFYDPQWNYSPAQSVSYEEAIFDHMYQNIGRGVIFNQMWHDYSLCPKQKSKVFEMVRCFFRGRRILSKNTRPLYDAIKVKFATHDIYCAEGADLANKLCAMAQWNYEWKSDENQITIDLDLSEVISDTVADYTGGMGIRIENTKSLIQSVLVNGLPHYAFSDHVIILPQLLKNKNRMVVTLGPVPSRTPRLTFISKRLLSIRKTGDGLETIVLTKSKARFSFFIESPFILLNADWQEWNRNDDHILRGYVMSNRRLVLREVSKCDFVIVQSTVPIVGFNESESRLLLTLGGHPHREGTIGFRCFQTPRELRLNHQSLGVRKEGEQFQVNLPEYHDKAEFIVLF